MSESMKQGPTTKNHSRKWHLVTSSNDDLLCLRIFLFSELMRVEYNTKTQY